MGTNLTDKQVTEMRDAAQRLLDADEGHRALNVRSAWDVRNLCDDLLSAREQLRDGKG